MASSHARLVSIRPLLFQLVLSLLLTSFSFHGNASQTPAVGINYGRLGDNLPPPEKVVNLILKLKAGYVKIYDTDPTVIKAFANTGVPLAVGVTNEEVSAIGDSQTAADSWLQKRILPFVRFTQINIIVVGNEVLSHPEISDRTWPSLLPAMQNIFSSLEKFGLGQTIKVTTSVAMDALKISYPPSAGRFQDNLVTVFQSILDFLSRSQSYLFLDAYPYLAWEQDTKGISVDFALSSPNAKGFQDGELKYSNMLDAQIDAVVAAIEALGFGNLPLALSETGWPTLGDSSIGATIPNAALYNSRLVKKILSATGTPKRPNTFFPTYVFALFNENQKPGPTVERNWGLLHHDGSPVYLLDFTGNFNEPKQDIVKLIVLTPLVAKRWCVAREEVQPATLQRAIDYACEYGGNCSAIQNGQPCYIPDTIVSHASYAFNSYWQKMKSSGASCDFNGSATVTHIDPSYKNCTFL